jgi:hypothetical protein
MCWKKEGRVSSLGNFYNAHSMLMMIDFVSEKMNSYYAICMNYIL